MANPPRAKGTAGETELRRLLEELTNRRFRRTSAGCQWDLETMDDVFPKEYPISILATRPDHGRWLVSMPPEQWLLDWRLFPIRVEVKRYARFALHTIYGSKFK